MEFPEILFKYCHEDVHKKLKDIWDSKSYDFADDRMRDICGLIGVAALFNSNEIPEGYKPLFAN